MINNNNRPLSPSAPNLSRRRFMQGASALVLGSSLPSMSVLALGNSTSGATGQAPRRLANNPLGFNGERQDPATGLYHLGQGYRVYNPALMRFHAADSMSPFGQGGVNAYAYCLGNPINLRDPSGHFAIMSLLIGAATGAVIGATTAAVGEGIRAGVTHTQFDWKQIAIGAFLGSISGGFGAAAEGTKTSVKAALSVADLLVSGSLNFGLGIATGCSSAQASTTAGISGIVGRFSFGASNSTGAVTGFISVGAGIGVGAVAKSRSTANEHLETLQSLGLSAKEARKPSHTPTSPPQSPEPSATPPQELDMRGTLDGLSPSRALTAYRRLVARQNWRTLVEQSTEIIPYVGHTSAKNTRLHILLRQDESPVLVDKKIFALTAAQNKHFRHHKKLMLAPYFVLMAGDLASLKI